MQSPDFINASLKTANSIQDIKNSGVVGAQINSTLQDTIPNLASNKISKIFVFDNAKPVGMITNGDIFKITVATNRWT